eukprot:6374515-Pyramimonas_sp.AAC.1
MKAFTHQVSEVTGAACVLQLAEAGQTATSIYMSSLEHIVCRNASQTPSCIDMWHSDYTSEDQASDER